MSRDYPCVYYDDQKCRLHSEEPDYTDWCVFGPCGHETPSKGDCIRTMSDEELAEWIRNGISSDYCDYCEYNNGYCDGSPCRGKADAEVIIEWLRRPANGEVPAKAPPLTRRERLNAMSDEELAAWLIGIGFAEHAEFCGSRPECEELLERDEFVPAEWCARCLAEWLRQEGAI